MSLWGEISCPKCINSLSNLNLVSTTLLPFNSSKIRSIKRIGPHNIEIYSIIFGSLLGDGFMEKHGEGSRLCFQQEGSHSSYLYWLHQYICQLGYCNKIIPQITTRLDTHGKIRQVLRFKTFTFSSFNWIEECFYKNINNIPVSTKQVGKKNIRIKKLPLCIEEFLTPLGLAIWIMDEGAKVSSGLKLCTNNFSVNENLILCTILTKKFGLKTTMISAGAKKTSISINGNIELTDQYNIYISKYSMEKLAVILKPFLHPSLKYKLIGHL